MKLKDTIAHSIKRYPGLYRDLSYHKSKIKVLDQYFLTNGNGMAWWDGFITDDCDMEYRPDAGGYCGVAGPCYGERTFDTTFPKGYFSSNNVQGLYDESHETFRKRNNIKRQNECNRHALSLYPLSKGYGHILFIPNNIKNDWLRGADEICQAGLEFWQSPEYWRSERYHKEIGKPQYPDNKIWTRQNWQNLRNEQIKLYVQAKRRIDKIIKFRGMKPRDYKLPSWSERAYKDYWYGVGDEEMSKFKATGKLSDKQKKEISDILTNRLKQTGS